MRKEARIKLSKENYDKAIDEIRKYFENERDEEIGQLQASMILDFFIENVGSHIYNQGVADMQKFMSEKVDDMYGYML